MEDFKIIKGQAWISGDSLVQDQIMVIPGVDSVSNVVCLIKNIWEDLVSSSGQYKTNDKGYFYWEYKQTFIDNPDLEITVNFECPSPKPGLFSEPYDPDAVQGDYAKYWVNKFKIAAENYEERIAIQRKQITFPGTEYIEANSGQIREIEQVTVDNTDLGTIENLLTLY